MQHQTLPANGQAQPLPAKWVIKRHPGNAEMVNKWANEKYGYERLCNVDNYITSTGNTVSDPSTVMCVGFTLITDTQFKAMVEGEKFQINNNCEIYHMPEVTKKERLETLNDLLIKAGFENIAAEIRRDNPDIWPVDYAAIVLEKAVAWAKLPSSERSEDLADSVRNYLTNQK